MMEAYSDVTIASWMTWFQIAVLLVPVMMATIYFEWKEWREAHPKAVRRYVQAHRRTHPTIPFVIPH